MVKVTIADIIERESKDERSGESRNQSVVVLLDRDGGRVAPIWIGQWEAGLIALALSTHETPRPMTYSFIASLLEGLGAQLEEVRVEALKDDTFYAIAKVRVGETTREIDCRPSDAIGIAVLTDSPIYAAEDVMEMAGMDIPEEFGGRDLQGEGVNRIVARVEQWDRKHQSPPTKEEQEKAGAERAESHRELWTALFGAEAEANG